MRKLGFYCADGVEGMTLGDVGAKHTNAYSSALLRVLQELAAGGSVGIKDGRKRHVLSLLKRRLGPVNSCGLCYVNLVLRLFKESDLLTATPDRLAVCVSELKAFDERVRTRFPATKTGKKRRVSFEMASYLAAKEVVKKLFDYDRFCGGQGMLWNRDRSLGSYIQWTSLKDWSAWDMIHALNVDACAYCNADAVFALRIDQMKAGTKNTFGVNELHKRSPLDHFYGYSEYPCLGLSLYNLVPSCTRCNTNMKGARKQDVGRHIHPYKESFDDGIRFYALFKNYASLTFPKEDSDVVLVLRRPNKCGNVNLIKKAMASATFFHLEEVYNQTYRRAVMDVVRRIIAFPASYLADMRNRYPGIDELVFNRMLIDCSLCRELINKERLSKMACDLTDQLSVMLDEGWLAFKVQGFSPVDKGEKP